MGFPQLEVPMLTNSGWTCSIRACGLTPARVLLISPDRPCSGLRALGTPYGPLTAQIRPLLQMGMPTEHRRSGGRLGFQTQETTKRIP